MLPKNLLDNIDNLKKEYRCEIYTQKGYIKNLRKLLNPYLEKECKDKLVIVEQEYKSDEITEWGYHAKVERILDQLLCDQSEKHSSSDNKSIKLAKFAYINNENDPNFANVSSKPDASPTVVEVSSTEPASTALAIPLSKGNSETNMMEDCEDVEIGDAEGSQNQKKRALARAVRRTASKSQPAITAMFQPIKKESTDIISQSMECDSDPEEVQKVKRFKSKEVTDIEKCTDDQVVVTRPAIQRCKICSQILDSEETKMYPGHPKDAGEEFIVLTDPKLSLFTGDEVEVVEYDERPQHKITGFSVYDKEGHLCPFESGLIEKNILIYFSGFVKPIYEEDPSPEGGIPAKDMGPINEWWISGFDGGERVLVGFSTAFGEYILMQPSDAYLPYYEAVQEKIYLSKLVIEFLVSSLDPAYEDLLNKLQTTVPPPGLSSFSEDTLLRHSQFICDQVHNFDLAGDEDETLITSPCMRSLVRLSGVTLGRRRAMRHAGPRTRVAKMPKFSKATTTPLVRDMFESFFADQLDRDGKSGTAAPKRMRCGVCDTCQQPDCGECRQCKDMIKFGGSGRSKQCCVNRKCPNLAIAEAEDNEIYEEIEGELNFECLSTGNKISRHKRTRRISHSTAWVGDPIAIDGRKTYYSAVSINGEMINVHDCVMVEPEDPKVPLYVARINHMWETSFGEKGFHADWFCRGFDTVLGTTAHPQELYVVDDCEDTIMDTITKKVMVHEFVRPDDWYHRGGVQDPETDYPEHLRNIDEYSFFYEKFYNPEFSRFEDLPVQEKPKDSSKLHKFCQSCERLKKLETFEKCAVVKKEEESSNEEISSVSFLGKVFSVGDCAFVHPEAYSFKIKPPQQGTEEKRKRVDEELYPEYYRKTSEKVKGSNQNTPEPFRIARIIGMTTKSSGNIVNPQEVLVRVAKFYRPENTHRGITASYQSRLNLLFYSDEETTINFGDIVGKCWVAYGENIHTDQDEFMNEGPHFFIFFESYNPRDKSFSQPPAKAEQMGGLSKGKGKGKGKSRNVAKERNVSSMDFERYPEIDRKLKSLDVFAGCGGLSEGLHQAGVAESVWAIEVFEPAAQAFRLNNPDATVFTDDCNALLKMAMEGRERNEKGQMIPQKGDVELICGGPPCQGFSGMNRFNSRQYSQFKNSLVASYLSYCDYYRPKFLILENVRNFVSYKCSLVLKLTMRVLLRMGYQCTFGILQAGNYGVAQTRRRAIIFAAAPGEKLPLYPEPQHSFSPRACQLSVVVDGKKYTSNCQWLSSAPLRTITVRDSMSDLPEIKNGAKKDEMNYETEPESHFQRLIRGNQYQLLRDHICKDMASLVEARMRNIPLAPGSDWRDLPNICSRLSDGNFSKKLVYTHADKKNGRSNSGNLRGVCVCASGRACDPMDKQYNTLIPWCLPHTGNRHNNWSGLYGRVEWDGFFSTTVTNPEPMGKQGRVLHPEQHRVVSVRECARSQGFPDGYRFYGSILEKHRQIGNAVPPPMAKAIGLELRRAIHKEKPDSETEPMSVDNFMGFS